MTRTQPLTPETLAAFQAELLELLDRHHDATEILQRLRANPRWAPLANFLADIEPRMLHVAAELVKTWGKRTLPESRVSDRTHDEQP